MLREQPILLLMLQDPPPDNTCRPGSHGVRELRAKTGTGRNPLMATLAEVLASEEQKAEYPSHVPGGSAGEPMWAAEASDWDSALQQGFQFVLMDLS